MFQLKPRECMKKTNFSFVALLMEIDFTVHDQFHQETIDEGTEHST